MAFFKITHASRKSNARTGIISVPHGKIHTPAFVPVATKGTLKGVLPSDLKKLGIQVAFVNTYHLALHPGADVLRRFGGIHAYSKLNIPLMSDSGGFQVFSLGGKKLGVPRNEEEPAPVLRINEEGVRFRSSRDGQEMLFTPEFSMRAQEKIGADIVMAFDECVYKGATRAYSEAATERTHQWLLRCIASKRSNNQRLYGIVQGGQFKDLRKNSALFVARQRIDGIAIGGVSVGETKKQMRDQVEWAAPYLPKELPHHLLGVGRVEDILDLVKAGIDTFDCVEPTRLARSGLVFRDVHGRRERIDVKKSKYRKEKSPIQKGCACEACRNFSLSFIHHLFHERELLGYYLATHHNLFFFEEFFSGIRRQIAAGIL